ncbi:DNA-binding transcriptional regulator, MarR family [Actinacidiphila paucisporea]|uniref:DNA-binding transcriptional regulator, MarR family n=2 Tax=Actinacidiphila paucisporea TaxID=310782 RepID=A0A1M7K1B2_9ACTN|nr:DNA-binding transcriptional regulator, MarR family [Actinacidiphila paucisporea]
MSVVLSDSYGGGMPRTDPARTADELTTLVAQLGRRLRAASAAAELTPSQQSVMGRLGRQGPATTAGLARDELVRPQSMRLTLAALEERGLVARAPHPTDGRQVVFSLTTEGAGLLGSGRAARRGWLAEAIDTGLTPDEHRALACALPLLRRLVESPHAPRHDPPHHPHHPDPTGDVPR